MARRKEETPLRVAAILVWLPPRSTVPLIATHVPAKADPIHDYSVTSLTARCDNRFEQDDAMSAAVQRQLHAYPAAVTRLPFAEVCKGRRYQWYLAICRSEQRFEPDEAKILQLIWAQPNTLGDIVLHMSDDRRGMFLSALHAAIALESELLRAYERPAALLQQPEGLLVAA